MKRHPVAAIVTEYRMHSHADVILGKILEGPRYDGKDLYQMEVVSMYVDQFPKNDMSRDLAKKHGFKLCKSIEEALTLGTGKIAIDGVLSIGEHGTYPTNSIGQLLYPRRRFFEETCNTFKKFGKTVPVFNDKHLAAEWKDAKWMYDKHRELMFPFMAGSSIPLTWRKPDFKLPKNCELTGAMFLGYGPYEGYGFHGIEALQCMVERRKGGEVGVKSVTALTGEAMWKAGDQGEFSLPLLTEAISRAPAHASGDVRKITAETKDAGIWIIEYRDGFKAAIAILNGFMYEGDGGGFCFAGQIKGETKPRSCQFYQQLRDPFGHFHRLNLAIESMITSGHVPYPVERTLLTTGILDAAMHSRHQNGKRIETPHLKIEYQPTEWPHATGPLLKDVQR